MTSRLTSQAPFLAFLVLMTFSSSFGQTYFFGVLQPSIRADFGLSMSDFGRLYLLVTLASALGVTFIGPLIDRMRLQTYSLLLGVLIILSISGLALSFSLVPLFLSMMAARTIGQGLMVHAAMTSASRYFSAGRGKAIALATIGIPLGQAVFPLVLVSLIESDGWRIATLQALAFFAFILFPFLRFFLWGHDTRHANWEAQEKEREKATRQGYNGSETLRSLRRADMIRDWRFYAVVPGLTLAPFWITAVFFYADHLANLRALDLAALTKTYPYHSIAGVLTPFLGGILVDRYAARHLLGLSPLALGGAFALLLLTDMPMAAFMATLGLAGWIAIPINNALWAELYGTRYLGEIKGVSNAVIVFSTAFSPFLVGELLSLGVGFKSVLWGAFLHSGLALIALIPLLRRQH